MCLNNIYNNNYNNNFFQTKPVAFSIRTNVGYNAEIDDESPLKGYTITFKTQEFLHIMVYFVYYFLEYSKQLKNIKIGIRRNLLYIKTMSNGIPLPLIAVKLIVVNPTVNKFGLKSGPWGQKIQNNKVKTNRYTIDYKITFFIF